MCRRRRDEERRSSPQVADARGDLRSAPRATDAAGGRSSEKLREAMPSDSTTNSERDLQ